VHDAAPVGHLVLVGVLGVVVVVDGVNDAEVEQETILDFETRSFYHRKNVFHEGSPIRRLKEYILSCGLND